MQELLKKQIEKLKELTEQYKMYYDSINSARIIKLIPGVWNRRTEELKSEIAALEKQIAETKEPALRDELIGYVKWQYNKFGIPEGEFSTKNIDEYLNSKNVEKCIRCGKVLTASEKHEGDNCCNLCWLQL